MPTTTFIAVCLGLIVLELGIMIAVFCVAMWKIRGAAQAVEVASYRVDQEILSFGQTMRSTWGEALRAVLSVGLRLFRD